MKTSKKDITHLIKKVYCRLFLLQVLLQSKNYRIILTEAQNIILQHIFAETYLQEITSFDYVICDGCPIKVYG